MSLPSSSTTADPNLTPISTTPTPTPTPPLTTVPAPTSTTEESNLSTTTTSASNLLPPASTSMSLSLSPSPSPDADANDNNHDDDDGVSPAELSAVVDGLLDSLTNKFSGVSKEIFGKMDDMARRLDALEELVQQSQQGQSQNSVQ
ncbi:MAG: hypothetical protein M1816_007114 [Peltula sp. TS41687]|nr:MAG: hypothetical protein M1816_007114 [Peltula sp. TS41687]